MRCLVLLPGLLAATTSCGPDSSTPRSPATPPEPLRIEGCGNEALYESSHKDCTPMDLELSGVCNCGPMGWYWDGEACVQPDDSYCICEGRDCDKLTQTIEECQAAHAACEPPDIISCGSADLYQHQHDNCAPMDVTGGEPICSCLSMGWMWDGSTCVRLSDSYCICEGTDCDKLTQTREACEIAHAACDKVKTFSCGSAALYDHAHDHCAPMDITGEGICNCVSMGWMWDGAACVQLDDDYCTCIGRDCDKLTQTREACELRHQSCP